MPLAAGKIGDSYSSMISATSAAFAAGATTVLLRVIGIKSSHFTFA
jgi:hypothetical protein